MKGIVCRALKECWVSIVFTVAMFFGALLMTLLGEKIIALVYWCTFGYCLSMTFFLVCTVLEEYKDVEEVM